MPASPMQAPYTLRGLRSAVLQAAQALQVARAPPPDPMDGVRIGEASQPGPAVAARACGVSADAPRCWSGPLVLARRLALAWREAARAAGGLPSCTHLAAADEAATAQKACPSPRATRTRPTLAATARCGPGRRSAAHHAEPLVQAPACGRARSAARAASRRAAVGQARPGSSPSASVPSAPKQRHARAPMPAAPSLRAGGNCARAFPLNSRHLQRHASACASLSASSTVSTQAAAAHHRKSVGASSASEASEPHSRRAAASRWATTVVAGPSFTTARIRVTCRDPMASRMRGAPTSCTRCSMPTGSARCARRRTRCVATRTSCDTAGVCGTSCPT